MTLERARRLVDGAWKYVTADESGGGGSQPVSVAAVTLDNDDVLALDSVPIVVVAAPGSGHMIIPLCALLVADTTGGAYNAMGATLSLGPDADGSAYRVLTELSSSANGGPENLLAAAGPALAVLAPVSSVTAPQPTDTVATSHGQSPVAYDDAPLLLALPVGSITEGNAANTLTVTVFYAVVAI